MSCENNLDCPYLGSAVMHLASEMLYFASAVMQAELISIHYVYSHLIDLGILKCYHTLHIKEKGLVRCPQLIH